MQNPTVTSNVGTERESRNSVLLQIVMQLKDTEREGEKGEKILNQNGLKASLVFNGISPEGVCSENSLCGAY